MNVPSSSRTSVTRSASISELSNDAKASFPIKRAVSTLQIPQTITSPKTIRKATSDSALFTQPANMMTANDYRAMQAHSRASMQSEQVAKAVQDMQNTVWAARIQYKSKPKSEVAARKAAKAEYKALKRSAAELQHQAHKAAKKERKLRAAAQQAKDKFLRHTAKSEVTAKVEPAPKSPESRLTQLFSKLDSYKQKQSELKQALYQARATLASFETTKGAVSEQSILRDIQRRASIREDIKILERRINSYEVLMESVRSEIVGFTPKQKVKVVYATEKSGEVRAKSGQARFSVVAAGTGKELFSKKIREIKKPQH